MLRHIYIFSVYIIFARKDYLINFETWAVYNSKIHRYHNILFSFSVLYSKPRVTQLNCTLFTCYSFATVQDGATILITIVRKFWNLEVQMCLLNALCKLAQSYNTGDKAFFLQFS